MFISYFGLFLIWTSIILFVVSFFIYSFNRKKYYNLINIFEKEQAFPAPYSFHALVGFFGAYQITKFFLKLKQGKKIRRLDPASQAYKFFDKENSSLTRWMFLFHKISFFSMLSLSAAILLGFALTLFSISGVTISTSF